MEIRVGLDRIADAMWIFSESAIELRVPIEQAFRAINVAGSSNGFSEAAQGDSLAEQFPALIEKSFGSRSHSTRLLRPLRQRLSSRRSDAPLSPAHSSIVSREKGP